MKSQLVARLAGALGLWFLLAIGAATAQAPSTSPPNTAPKVEQTTVKEVVPTNSTSRAVTPSFVDPKKTATPSIHPLLNLEQQRRLICRDEVVTFGISGQEDQKVKSALCDRQLADASEKSKLNPTWISSTLTGASATTWTITNSPGADAKVIKGLMTAGVREEVATSFVTRSLRAARSSVGRQAQVFVLVSGATVYVLESEMPSQSSSARYVNGRLSGRTDEEMAAELGKQVKHDRWFRLGIIVGVGVFGVVIYSMLRGRVFV